MTCDLAKAFIKELTSAANSESTGTGSCRHPSFVGALGTENITSPLRFRHWKVLIQALVSDWWHSLSVLRSTAVLEQFEPFCHNLHRKEFPIAMKIFKKINFSIQHSAIDSKLEAHLDKAVR